MKIEVKDIQNWLESVFWYNIDDSVEITVNPESNLDFFGFESNTSVLQSLSGWNLLIYVPESQEEQNQQVVDAGKCVTIKDLIDFLLKENEKALTSV